MHLPRCLFMQLSTEICLEKQKVIVCAVNSGQMNEVWGRGNHSKNNSRESSQKIYFFFSFCMYCFIV